MTAPAVRVGTPSASIVYIAIGSNLERPVRQVLQAKDALAGLPETRLLGLSPLYRNPAVGPGRQPEYVNAVAAVCTRLAPHDLLDALQAIEANQGRVRGPLRGLPRTLDLDLLLYGGRAISDQRLTVPHPRMQQRAFVLKPLLDLAPDLNVPGLGSITTLLCAVSQAALQRIDESEAVTAGREHGR
ncbi:MAG: 2-amino-4-hydroxy-6-hydroxymethyldihydropteridine diphosphokinase [Gammaproteobacteria bacterium]|nr:MAG: 2-amino-4-hydroxy-6-hydroxymethyldihydropteridine diphosphokinase [Gammaproteobacteria bacterium]